MPLARQVERTALIGYPPAAGARPASDAKSFERQSVMPMSSVAVRGLSLAISGFGAVPAYCTGSGSERVDILVPRS